MLVMKFGGTSVGSAECMMGVAEIVRQTRGQHPRLVVVVSAMKGMTDQLIDAARAAAEGRQETTKAIEASILDWHVRACEHLLADAPQCQAARTYIADRVAELERFCQSIGVLGEVTVRGLDMVSAIGEKLSATILTALLCARGIAAEYVDASRVLLTDDRFGAANPLLAETTSRLEAHVRPLVERGLIPVVTGYVGATAEGVPTTLGRGGGDYSAAIIGACMRADEVWIWSDVDGILTADPNLVPEARTLEELSCVEAAELAYFGAEVLHPNTIKRYGDVVAVAVEISTGGTLMDVDSDVDKGVKLPEKWWQDPNVLNSDSVTVREGYLMNRWQTPFAYVNFDDFEVTR